MTENYDILKENNLRQMVVEYEKAHPSFLSEQDMRRTEMLAWQLLEERVLDDERVSLMFWSEVSDWTKTFYDNLQANLIRKYAIIHDSKSIDKYPVQELFPIHHLIKQWDYFPFEYTTLREILSKYSLLDRQR